MAPEDIDPLTLDIPSSSRVLLVSGNSAQTVPGVYAGKQTINAESGAAGGSFAWWVGDEGIKARIDTQDPLRGDNALTQDDLVGPTSRRAMMRKS